MDWNKYKSYYNPMINSCCCVENTTTSNFWDIVEELQNNVVADVTDSYKELSSERVEE